MEEEYLSIKDAMNRTGKSEVTIRRLIRMLRTQFSVELGDSNDTIIQKMSLLRKRNESTDKDGEPVFEWLVATSALENLIDDSQSPSYDVEQQVAEQGQQTPDDAREDEPEPSLAGGQPKYDVTHEDDQRASDVGQDDAREGSQRADDQHHDKSSTKINDVTVEILGALRAELEEKNKQIERLHRLIGQAQNLVPAPDKPQLTGQVSRNNDE